MEKNEKNVVVDYTVLKNIIIKSSVQTEKGTNKFSINFDKLQELASKEGLVLMKNNSANSNPINENDVLFLSEFFKGNKLSWLNNQKEFIILTFVVEDSLDKSGKEFIESLNNTSDNTEDTVSTFANILANYPCYTVAIVSYISNEPKRFGKPSYEIKCRKNAIAIKKDEKK